MSFTCELGKRFLPKRIENEIKKKGVSIDDYLEFEEDPLFGVADEGPVGSEDGVEDVAGLLGWGLAGRDLDLVGQCLHSRLQLHFHLSISMSIILRVFRVRV